MKTLVLDTSSEVLVIGLVDGHTIAWECQHRGIRDHISKVFEKIEEGLNACSWGVADIARVICGVGPGSFTGLRIGVSALKGMFACRDVEAFRVSSLDALAHGLVAPSVLALTDARRESVYATWFDGERRRMPEGLYSIEEVSQWGEDNDEVITLVGDACSLCEARLRAAWEKTIVVPARDGAIPSIKGFLSCVEKGLCLSVALSDMMPQYIRLSAAEEAKQEGMNNE